MLPVSLAIECAEGWQNLCLDAIDGHPLGIVVEFILLFYAFAGLAIVCDEYLVPSLETLCLRWGVREDVAGASFMAFGSAAPEIIINAVTTVQGSENVELGVGAIIGSGMIAFMCIPSMCTLLSGSGEALIIKRRPLLRDVLFYSASLTALCLFFADGQIFVYEGAILISIYVVYILVVFFSPQLRTWWTLRALPDEASRSRYIMERSVSFVSKASVSVAGSTVSSAALLADHASEYDDDDSNGSSLSGGKSNSFDRDLDGFQSQQVLARPTVGSGKSKLGRAAPGTVGKAQAMSYDARNGNNNTPGGGGVGAGAGPLSLNRGQSKGKGKGKGMGLKFSNSDSDDNCGDYDHDDGDNSDDDGLSGISTTTGSMTGVVHSGLLKNHQSNKNNKDNTATATVANANAVNASASASASASTHNVALSSVEISNNYDFDATAAAAAADTNKGGIAIGGDRSSSSSILRSISSTTAAAVFNGDSADSMFRSSSSASGPGLLKTTPRHLRRNNTLAVSFVDAIPIDLNASTSASASASASASGVGMTAITIAPENPTSPSSSSSSSSATATATATATTAHVTNVPLTVTAPSAARRALLRQISQRGLPDASPSLPTSIAHPSVARRAVLRQINLRGLRLARGYPGYGVSNRAREAKETEKQQHHEEVRRKSLNLHQQQQQHGDAASKNNNNNNNKPGYIAPRLVARDAANDNGNGGGRGSMVVVSGDDDSWGTGDYDAEAPESKAMSPSTDPHYGTMREGTGIIMLGGGGGGDNDDDDDSDDDSENGSDLIELDDEPPGIIGKIVGVLCAPLKFAFKYTCPHAVPGGPWERWYLPAFLISFLWVAVFAMIVSAVVGQWVTKVNVSMEFFGLVLVAGGAEIPDMIQSVTVARRGYGSMATSNCIGSQITNILVGLGLPWFISTLATGKPILIRGHEKLFRAALIQSANMVIFFAVTLGAAFLFKKNKVELTMWKGRLNLSLYVVSIAVYAFITFCTYSWCSSRL